MNLRALSLDSTTPADYDPVGDLHWNASLTEIADFYGSDKGALKHNYTRVYERVVSRGIENLLEIGVACGASLKMWSRWAPGAKIDGMDIRPECARLCKDYPNVSIAIADATTTRVPGEWDVIVDDGSHLPGHIVKAFTLYWPSVRPGGVYCIEDLKCTTRPHYCDRFDVPAEDKSRQAFVAFVDGLMRICDSGGGVASLEYAPQLLIIRKANG